LPRNNRDWWASKIRRNQERDRETARTLTEVGWRVVEVWEHEDAVEAAARIAVVLRGGEPSVRGVTERLASSAPSANTSWMGAPRA
jgi:G:T-mismatch repair DNA endonuclease (very short patch repair protein)